MFLTDSIAGVREPYGLAQGRLFAAPESGYAQRDSEFLCLSRFSLLERGKCGTGLGIR